MGYFRAASSAGFTQLPDGRTGFYPYGIFSAGYVLSGQTEEEIRRYIKRCTAIWLPIAIVSVCLFKAYALLLIPVTLALYSRKIACLLKDAEKLEQRLSIRESLQHNATAMGVPWSVLLLLGSCLFTAICIAALFTPKGRDQLMLIVLCTILFSLCSVHFAFLTRYAILARRSHKK